MIIQTILPVFPPLVGMLCLGQNAAERHKTATNYLAIAASSFMLGFLAIS